MNETVRFTFDGNTIEGRYGESLGAALCAAGIIHFRETRTGETRGMFCGMGVCQDCLLEVDGKPNQRACMTKLETAVNLRSELFGRVLASAVSGEPPKLIDAVPEETPEILVIGAGPAGLSAAIAARQAGAYVTIVDERTVPGGQYFKQVLVAGRDVAPPDPQHEEGAKLIAKARAAGVEIRSGVDIWGAFSPTELIGTEGGYVRRFSPKRLIVATGAYERGVPFPGWTLPGVMTTGAAQTLWRSYRRLAGKRILIAGHGPLNMQVASELTEAGAEVVALVELAQVSLTRVWSDFLRMLRASPRLVVEGLRYRAKLAGVPIIYGSAVARVEKHDDGLVAHVRSYPSNAGEQRTFAVDAVCLGYGFQPSNEILRALGCEHRFDERHGQFTAVVDDKGATNIEGVFSLGDCTGLGGARAALAEGTIVGTAAAADLGHQGSRTADTLVRARKALSRHRQFQDALWKFYSAPRLNLQLATGDTVVCRCEEVTAERIAQAMADGRPSIGDLKRATRAGMGPCQGRYCGPILSEMVALDRGQPLDESGRFAPRMPVKPVAIADIARHFTP